MNRRDTVLGLLALGAAPLSAFAQQPAKVFRIGFLGQAAAATMTARVDPLRAGLRDLGYIEGRNLVIDVCAWPRETGDKA